MGDTHKVERNYQCGAENQMTLCGQSEHKPPPSSEKQRTQQGRCLEAVQPGLEAHFQLKNTIYLKVP